MAIKRVKISNFKSFKNLDINLGKFNVLIGANASGKSNFIQILKFLKDIANYSLVNAISMQGDTEYFRNINIGSSTNFSVEIISDEEDRIAFSSDGKILEIKTYEMIYRLDLMYNEEAKNFKIAEDKLRLKCEFVRLERQKGKKEPKEHPIGKGEFNFTNNKGKITFSLKQPKGVSIKKEHFLPSLLFERKLKTNVSLLETGFFIMPFDMISFFRGISIYNFDPRLAKKAALMTGKAFLEENGSNLAIPLNNILQNEDKERKFYNLVRDLLSFVNKLDIEEFIDKSMLFKIQEKYFKKYLPASLLSDGTINITALIVALYFERKPLCIIEEPERNLHPYLISKIIDMMKDASQTKQIIITTHNPEIVKYADLGNILLVSRDKEGFSSISKPSEKKEIKTFLKNEMGIEELYVQNLLEL